MSTVSKPHAAHLSSQRDNLESRLFKSLGNSAFPGLFYMHIKDKIYACRFDYLHKKSLILMQKGDLIMHIFGYSFLQNGLLPAGLLNITADIYTHTACHGAGSEGRIYRDIH